MSNPAYAEFINGVNEYYRLYNLGLKKQGNAYLREFVQKFRQRPEDEKNEVLNDFCRFVCDTEDGKALLERGNGSLPYEVNRIIWEYLKEKCNQNEMPHLRWFYELFNGRYAAYKDDADTVDFLKRAYAHKDCDEKTVEFYYRHFLDVLSYGAHHFPECCLIDKEEYEFVFEKLKQISSEHAVPENLLQDADYFRKLYNAWESYLSENKKRPFEEYCADAGITFNEIITIYY